MVEFVCFFCWSIYVFRNTDGDTDFAGVNCKRDGEGTSTGALACGSGIVFAEYAGDQECDGDAEDGGLCFFGNCNGDGVWVGVRDDGMRRKQRNRGTKEQRNRGKME